MDSKSVRRRVSRSVWLLSAAALTFAGHSTAMAAEVAPAAPASPVEEVLITGSLISGAEAVGVPVTAIGEEEFAEQAAVTVSDVLRKVPAVEVIVSTAHSASGSNLTKAQRASIHGQGASRTLMLIDGMRYPLTGVYYDGYDPSLIPSIAVQRVDVLADGASATYGSDAIAGVINVIMQRGYQGARTQAMYQYADGGGNRWQASQLFGHAWETGDITVAADYYDTEALPSRKRDRVTWDFTPWGFDNRIPLRSSIPATVSIGNAALPSQAANPVGFSGSGCTNCFLVPRGQNGVGLTWAAIQSNPMVPQTPTNPGVNNLVDPHQFAEFLGAEERAAFTATFRQDIIDGVQFFADGFYANRRNLLHASPVVNPWTGGTFLNTIVPTTNPYFPAGAPANIRVNYSTALELDIQHKVKEQSHRFAAGFNLDLPYEWNGRLYYNLSDEQNHATIENTANANNILAALGNIVGDPNGVLAPYMVGTAPRVLTAGDIAANRSLSAYTPGTAVRVISPSTVPFLNVFCDPITFNNCNDPRTLDFIRAHWTDDAQYQINEVGAVFDGPLFDLPGGPLRAAVGVTYTSDSLRALGDRTQGLASAEFSVPVIDNFYRNVWAGFAQVLIPVVGEMNALPFMQRLEIEAAARYDDYSDFGSTFNPKIGANWEVAYGLQLRGSWGTSFAAPAFQYLGRLAGKNISATNTGAGAATNTAFICSTNAASTQLPVAGSAAADILASIGAANCSDAAINAALAALPAGHPYFGYNATQIRFPGQLSQNGGSLTAYGVVRPAGQLGPEEATNWSVGFNWTPDFGFLEGLNVHLTYYNIEIEDYLAGAPATGLNDPDARQYLTVKGAAAATNNPNPTVPFDVALNSYLTSPAIAGGAALNAATITVLVDSMVRNLLRQEYSGYDFGASYNWEMANWGAFNIGITGTYTGCTKTTATTTSGTEDTCNEDDQSTNYGVAGNTFSSRWRGRGEIGWADADMGWSGAFFVNYRSHFFTTQAPPPDATINNALGTNLVGDALDPIKQEISYVPEQFTFDLSIAYDLADRPMNPWLHNLNFRLTVNDIFDKHRNPPFTYRTAQAGAGPLAFDGTVFNPIGRIISFQVTKDW